MSLINWIKSLKRKDDSQRRKKTCLIDENGEPVVWYRGMRASDYKDGGITAIDNGVYFCDSETVARSYASKDFVLRVHISVADPFIIDAKNKGYEYICWDCNPSSIQEFTRFKKEIQKEYPFDRFSTDETARYIRKNTSHDAVIIHNVYEEGIFNNSPITDIVIWDNACVEVITD